MNQTARSASAVLTKRTWLRTTAAAILLAALALQSSPSQAVGEATVAGTFVGFADDRVRAGEDENSLTGEGSADGVYRFVVNYTGTHEIAFLEVSKNGSVWNTLPGDGMWIAGVTNDAPDAPFLNAYDAPAAIGFTDTKTVLVYLADDSSQAAGTTYDVEVCFEDETCALTQVTTTADADGDGYTVGGGDCDDEEPAVNPGATEDVTNGRDDDCDGQVDETDSSGPANTAPSATAGSDSTDEDTPVTVTLTGTDGEDDPLTFVITSLPTSGSLSDGTTAISAAPFELVGADVTYTPNADYSGSDSFDFKVNDGVLDSATGATVSLTVDPVADGTSLASVISSNGSYTNKGSRTTLTSNVGSDEASCRGNRLVTFAVTDTFGTVRTATGLSSATSTPLGAVSAQLQLPIGTHTVSLSTPATTSPSCPAASNPSAGTVTILATKPTGKSKP